jgi:hypothetical protein
VQQHYYGKFSTTQLLIFGQIILKPKLDPASAKPYPPIPISLIGLQEVGTKVSSHGTYSKRKINSALKSFHPIPLHL